MLRRQFWTEFGLCLRDVIQNKIIGFRDLNSTFPLYEYLFKPKIGLERKCVLCSDMYLYTYVWKMEQAFQKILLYSWDSIKCQY